MAKKVYLAAPFFSPEQVARVERVEAALAANPTVSEFYTPRLNQKTANLEFSAPWAAEVYDRDMTQVKAADVLVTVIDFEKETIDPGTAYELGAAKILAKPVIALQEKTEAVNIMVTETLHWYTKDAAAIATYDFDKMEAGTYVGEYL